MDAYKLADELEIGHTASQKLRDETANMLRQQADRIAELEQNLSAYIVELELHKAMIQDLEKQSKPIGVYDGKNVHICTPQTKPLSDEEIKAIAAQNRTDLSIPAYISFARAIEERHGIK